MRPRYTLPAACLAAAISVLAGPGAAALDIPVLEVPCLCKLGNREAGYRGNIAVTDANRDSLRALIERRGLVLGATVTLKGAGCDPVAWPHPIHKPTCGQTSVSRRAADGATTQTMVDNAPFTGTVSIRIFSNAGIPQTTDPDGSPRVNLEQWSRSRSIAVLGDAR
jgi:hypothetical protein